MRMCTSVQQVWRTRPCTTWNMYTQQYSSWPQFFLVGVWDTFIVGAAFSSQILSESPEAADSQLFFLSSRAGRGNTCSVAAAFKKGKDDNGSLTVRLQNMGKESKVRMVYINNKRYIFNNMCPLYWHQQVFLWLFFIWLFCRRWWDRLNCILKLKRKIKKDGAFSPCCRYLNYFFSIKK